MADKKFYDKFIKKGAVKEKTKTEVYSKKDKEKKENIFRNKTFSVKPEKNAVTIQKPDSSFNKNLFESITEEQGIILNSFYDIANSVLKLGRNREKEIYKNIRELFHELTDERGTRKLNYLNNPIKLSAYIFHYMWWNLFRLVKLFNSIEINLDDGDSIGDFGSGPLTAVCALWIAKPELRRKKLNFYCADISAKALNEGLKIFEAVCSFSKKDKDICSTWKIIKVNGEFGKPLKQKLSLFISANMFNEIFWDSSVHIEFEAKRAAQVIIKYLKHGGKLLVVEPGIPLAGRFISILRKFLLNDKCEVYSPCPHLQNCPIKFDKNRDRAADFTNTAVHNKWCHFSFSVRDAPPKLISLSAAAGLEKTAASLSFIFAGLKNQDRIQVLKTKDKTDSENSIIIITSNIIKLPFGKIGRYACCNKGFLLLAGEEKSCTVLKKCKPGSYFKIRLKQTDICTRDKKTNALLVNVKD